MRGTAAEARPGWRGIERPPAPPTGSRYPRELRLLPANHHLPTADPSSSDPTRHLRDPHPSPVAHCGSPATASEDTQRTHHRRETRAPPGRGAEAVGARGAQLPRSFLPGTPLLNACSPVLRPRRGEELRSSLCVAHVICDVPACLPACPSGLVNWFQLFVS